MQPNESANAGLARKLREMAGVLTEQNADGFRIAAYRRAADTVENLAKPVSEIVAEAGPSALIALPAIGRSIASSLVELVETGRWSALDRLTGALEPERLFQTVPGIGPELAHSIHERLHVDILEALEVAANNGNLTEVPGIGPRRCSAIRALLKERLDRGQFRSKADGDSPSSADLLSVDAEYRHKAGKGDLKMIAPRRFNPEGRAWLPVLHAERGPWSFTALHSNTHRAHQLDRTQDWVVVFAHQSDGAEKQFTVVTEHRGPLAGKRVIRGRESECIAHYSR
ncbi:MAG: helix-hairpin-helix domain-containing protein [Hyphomicrobiaceae bacterium]